MNMKLPIVHNDWRKETNKGNDDNSLPWKTEEATTNQHHHPPDNRDEMEWLVFSPETINYEQIQLDSGNKAH